MLPHSSSCLLLVLISHSKIAMGSHVRYVPEPEDTELLKTCCDVYLKFKQYPQALRMAMMLNDLKLVREVFEGCSDP